MINLKRISLAIFLCLFIFAFNICEAKSYNLNNSIIKTMEISYFIPEDNELLFYSNYKNNEINRFVKQSFTNNEIKKLNIMKDGLMSFLGFNIKDNLNNIYDGEFVFSTFKKPNKKRELLIIFKSKNKSNLNKIFNIEDNEYNINEIIDISRPKTLNSLTHITQTNDNFIICASNKDLIINSLKSISSNKLKKIRKEKFKYYENILNNKRLFLYTNKQFYNLVDIKPFNDKNINYLTQFYYDKNKLILKSFSLNSDKTFIQNDLNLPENNDILLLANDISIYNDLLKNSVRNKSYKELIKDISKIVKDKMFIQIDNNNWIIGFVVPQSDFSINQLNALSEFHQDKFKNNNDIYTIFSKNNLVFTDQKTIFKSEQPIFVYESNNLTLLSNNLFGLLNTLKTYNLENIFNAESSDFIIDDRLIIRNFNNQIFERFLSIFDLLNYFTSDGLSLKLDSFESNTTQKIPEILPKIQIKTYINFN